MAGIQVPLGTTVGFEVTTNNPSTGNYQNGDSVPTYKVYAFGSDTPLLTGNLTLRTSLAGQYYATFVASSGNGFAYGTFYSVVAEAVVNSVDSRVVPLLFFIPTPVYFADIQFTRDQSNTQDEYTVTWFRDGVRITSGITSPQIQVIKRVDGTNLVAATTMTQIGTTGSYKYDEATNRLTLGEAAVVVVTATIDGASQTWVKNLGRDS
jgi:hypothetical protein